MRGDRRFRYGLCALALATVSGCWWPAPGQGPDRAAFNPRETTLTPDTVSGMTQLWDAPLDEASYWTGALVTDAGNVYINDLDSVYRLSAADGARVWKTPALTTDGEIQSQPIVVDDRILASDVWTDHVGLAVWRSWWLDPATGNRIGPGPAQGDVVARRGTRVLFNRPVSVGVEVYGNGFVAADLADPNWSSSATFGLGLYVRPPQPSTLGRERMYHSGSEEAPSGGAVSYVRAYPLTEGTAEPLWTTNPVSDYAGNYTAPVLSPDESTLFVGSLVTAHSVFALDPSTGATLWSADVGSGVTAPPALADGRLYVPTSDGDVVVLDAAGCGAAVCTPLWIAATDSEITGQPAVAGGVVYTGSADGGVAAFAASGCASTTCTALWEGSTSGTITSAPAVSGGRLLVVAREGLTSRVVAFGLPG